MTWEVTLIESDGQGGGLVTTVTQDAPTALKAGEQAAISLGWAWMPELHEADSGEWLGTARGVTMRVNPQAEIGVAVEENPYHADLERFLTMGESDLRAVLLDPETPAPLLAPAAEAYGRVATTAQALEYLTSLLSHPEDAVQAGAAYGLGRHLGDQEVQDLFCGLLDQGVGEALWDAIHEEMHHAELFE